MIRETVLLEGVAPKKRLLMVYRLCYRYSIHLERFLAVANLGASRSVVCQNDKNKNKNASGGLVNVYKPHEDIEEFNDVELV